ncbi:hypothetical protein F8S12_05590 [Nostoc sp. WHI]|nr:hypothetical protein [Nostoc sp. WHI]
MLGKWLPGLFGSKNDGIVSTDLRVGDATQIEGNLPSSIRDRYTLPAYTTAQQVLDEAEVAGTLKAQKWLHTKFSRHKLKQLQSLAEMYKNQLALFPRSHEGYRKTFTIGLMPGVIFTSVFLMLVNAGVALGVR